MCDDDQTNIHHVYTVNIFIYEYDIIYNLMYKLFLIIETTKDGFNISNIGYSMGYLDCLIETIEKITHVSNEKINNA